MAACRQCGANQGCSCQLKNGLCPSCYSKSLQVVNPNTQTNVSTKTK